MFVQAAATVSLYAIAVDVLIDDVFPSTLNFQQEQVSGRRVLFFQAGGDGDTEHTMHGGRGLSIPLWSAFCLGASSVIKLSVKIVTDAISILVNSAK